MIFKIVSGRKDRIFYNFTVSDIHYILSRRSSLTAGFVALYLVSFDLSPPSNQTRRRAVCCGMHHFQYRRVMLLSLQKRNGHIQKTQGFAMSQLSTESQGTSFFSYTSGRSRRRRRRQLLLAQRSAGASKRKADEEPSADAVDTRTIMDILYPNPFKGMERPDRIKWPKTMAKWREALSLAWQDYKSTWVGFTTSKGLFVEDVDPDQQMNKEQIVENIKSKGKEVMVNVKRNTRFLNASAMKIRKEVHERTGITNMEDVKAFAADAMRLATECLNQFMQGYRKGRDDEVEKMLTQYFQNLEQQANEPKKKRRKPQRRVPNRFHPMNH